MGIEAETKSLLEAGKADEAVTLLTCHLQKNTAVPHDKLFYLLGNVYRKQSNWQLAINAYSEACALNPESPAAEARAMLLDILDFYHKDLYNP